MVWQMRLKSIFFGYNFAYFRKLEKNTQKDFIIFETYVTILIDFGRNRDKKETTISLLKGMSIKS